MAPLQGRGAFRVETLPEAAAPAAPAAESAAPAAPQRHTGEAATGFLALGARGAGEKRGGVAAEAEWVLSSLAEELGAAGLTWDDVVFVGVYLRSLADFAAVNAVYRRHLPMRCPAARMCVAPSGLAGDHAGGSWAGGGAVAMDCVAWASRAAAGQESTLHVQSVSRWAPSNIGPYSQAKVLGGRLVLVAGQIALDPASMELVGPAAPAQAAQCAANLEAILGVLGSSLARAVRVTLFVAAPHAAAPALAALGAALGRGAGRGASSRGRCSVDVVAVPAPKAFGPPLLPPRHQLCADARAQP